MDEANKIHQRQIEGLARTSLRRKTTLAQRKQALRDLASIVTAESNLATPLLNKLMAAWLARKIDHETKTVLLGILERMTLPKNLDAKPIHNLLLYDPVYYKAAGDLANSIRPDYGDALCRYAFTNLWLARGLKLPRLLELAGDFLDPSSYPVLLACRREKDDRPLKIQQFVVKDMIARGRTPSEALDAYCGFFVHTRFLGTDAEFYAYVVSRYAVRYPHTKASDLMDAIDMAGDCMVGEKVYDIAPFTSFHDFKISKVPDYLDLTIKALNRSLEELHMQVSGLSGTLRTELSDLGVTVNDEAPTQPRNPAADLYYQTRLDRLFYHIPARLQAKRESE